MSSSSRFPAVLAYLPVIGWLYVFLFHRQNSFALYHLRQAIGLILFLIGAMVVWVVIAWIIAWIPYMAVFSIALFTIVIAVYMYGFMAWLVGLFYAITNRAAPLPWFGKWASRLPIH